MSSSQNKELLKTGAFTNGSESCLTQVLDNGIQMGQTKQQFWHEQTHICIILRYAVIPLQLESKGDAKCLGERKEQGEAAFLSYVFYFLIAVGIPVKLNCNSCLLQ